jgi:hypothetical protein
MHMFLHSALGNLRNLHGRGGWGGNVEWHRLSRGNHADHLQFFATELPALGDRGGRVLRAGAVAKRAVDGMVRVPVPSSRPLNRRVT